MRGDSLLVAVNTGVMLRRLSEDVQSSLQLHSRRLNEQPLEHPATSSQDKFVPAAAAGSVSAASPSSVASGMTRDAAFSVDGSSIADEGRSTQSRMSFHAARDASSVSSRPLTFGETARASSAQPCSSLRPPTPTASQASSSSARHRILGEIEGLMLALKSGGGRT